MQYVFETYMDSTQISPVDTHQVQRSYEYFVLTTTIYEGICLKWNVKNFYVMTSEAQAAVDIYKNVTFVESTTLLPLQQLQKYLQRTVLHLTSPDTELSPQTS